MIGRIHWIADKIGGVYLNFKKVDMRFVEDKRDCGAYYNWRCVEMHQPDNEYDEMKSLQKDNHESSGKVKNQNEHFNIRKQALGPNTRRGK